MSAPNTVPDIRETELIQRVCSGDHEAFYELMKPYEKAVYFAARSVVNNPADAEELTGATSRRRSCSARSCAMP